SEKISPLRATDIMYMLPRLSSWITSAAVSVDLTSFILSLLFFLYCNEVSPSPCTATLAQGEVLSKEERTIQPSLRCASTPLPTRAALQRKMKSPFNCVAT